MKTQKWVALCLLLVATITVVVMGTEAAYHSTLNFSGTIRTASFDLAASDTQTVSQTFEELKMEPNKDYTRTIKVDTSGCEVDKMNVYINLSVQKSGTVPPGFSVKLDGQSKTTHTIEGAQYSVRTIPLTFRWDLNQGEDAQAYKDFNFSYTVTVEGRQMQ